MPRGDGTGPFGRGSMTGRRAGYCAGNERPGYQSSGAGRKLGRKCGFFNWGRDIGQEGVSILPPRGFRRMRGFLRYGNQNPMSDPGLEKQELKRYAEVLRAELDTVEKRLNETGGY